jgi:hypothetical protein
MTSNQQNELESRLLAVLKELERQEQVSTNYPPHVLQFADEMKQIHEYVELAGEYGLAYESLVATIESHPFVLTGKAAISLLEIGLLLGFKTDRKEDRHFDRRQNSRQV